MIRTDYYAQCLDTRRSMKGSVVYLNRVPVTFRSSTWKMVSLLTTKVELNATDMGVQDASFIKNTPKSIGLKGKLSSLASIDNGGTVDTGYDWSAGGRTHHMEVKQNYLQELIEEGIV